MAKKKSQPGEPKQGLPRLMELAMTRKAPMVGGIILSVLATVASFVPYLAIYFVIREIAGVYPDFSALNVNAVPRVWRACVRRRPSKRLALYCIRGAVAYCGVWNAV